MTKKEKQRILDLLKEAEDSERDTKKVISDAKKWFLI